MKKQNGITLVVLIITIIVMFILAAVVLNIATNDDGLVDTALTAGFKSDIRQIQEVFEVKKNELILDNIIGSIPKNTLMLLGEINQDLGISNDIIEKYGRQIGIGIKDDGKLKLYYDSNSSLSSSQKEWLESIGIAPWNTPEPPPPPYGFTLKSFEGSRTYSSSSANGMSGGMYIVPKETFKQVTGTTDEVLNQYGINTNTFELLNEGKVLSCSGTDPDSGISSGSFEFFHAGIIGNITKNYVFSFFSDSNNVYLMTSNNTLSAAAITNDNISEFDDLVFLFVNTDSRLSVTYNLTNITSSNTNTKVERNSNYTTTLIPETNYKLPETIQVAMGEKEIVLDTDYTYNNETGELNIENITGNLVITAVGEINNPSPPPIEERQFTLKQFADLRVYQSMNKNGIISGMYLIPKETFKERVDGITDDDLSQYGINTNTFEILNEGKELSCSGTDLDSNISGEDFEFFHAGMMNNITKNNLFTFASDSSYVYIITSNSTLSSAVIIDDNITDYDDLVFSFVEKEIIVEESIYPMTAQVGDNAYATLTKDGELIISGTGSFCGGNTQWDPENIENENGGFFKDPGIVEFILANQDNKIKTEDILAIKPIMESEMGESVSDELVIEYIEMIYGQIIVGNVKADEIYDAIGCELSYIEELVVLDAVIIESGITEIGAAGIAIYDNITSLSIPNTVTAIRGRIGGSGITEITIPESVVVMEGAFKNYDGILGIPFVSKEEADSVWGSNWLDSESNPTFIFNK